MGRLEAVQLYARFMKRYPVSCDIGVAATAGRRIYAGLW
jgi:hypothetical protein